MISLYTVVDVTQGDMQLRATSTRNQWRTGKVHSFDNEAAAKSRRTQLANLHKGRRFAILLTEVLSDLTVITTWVAL